jgi:membrane protease YdiL (CAAX protease family)
MPISGCIYYLLGGTSSSTPAQLRYRLCGGLIHEVISLTVLCYVMSIQRKKWKDMSANLTLVDIPRGLGLIVVAYIGTLVFLAPFQYAYRTYFGHVLAPKPLDSMFGFGVSALSIAFICLNPFFEELIVRAYTATEVMNLGGSRALAITISVAAQMSYHLYQGLLHSLALTMIFTAFSVYFVRTKRIGPVIFAHLCLDLLALLSGRF